MAMVLVQGVLARKGEQLQTATGRVFVKAKLTEVGTNMDWSLVTFNKRPSEWLLTMEVDEELTVKGILRYRVALEKLDLQVVVTRLLRMDNEYWRRREEMWRRIDDRRNSCSNEPSTPEEKSKCPSTLPTSSAPTSTPCNAWSPQPAATKPPEPKNGAPTT